MARHSRSPSSSLDSPRLARPRSDVAEQLTKRIEAGTEIQSRVVLTADDLRAYETATTKWREYNYALLKVLVTNEIIAYEYRGERASYRFFEFFTARIRNARKRGACVLAVDEFLTW